MVFIEQNKYSIMSDNSVIFYDRMLWDEHSLWCIEQFGVDNIIIHQDIAIDKFMKNFIRLKIIFIKEMDYNWYKIMFPEEGVNIRPWRRIFSK